MSGDGFSTIGLHGIEEILGQPLFQFVQNAADMFSSGTGGIEEFICKILFRLLALIDDHSLPKFLHSRGVHGIRRLH